MTVYRDVILEPVVKPWIKYGQHFILEEDDDSGHGTGKNNIVRTWKEQNGLEYYFNYHSSPDLSPIKNCWQAPKAYIRKYPHWDDRSIRSLIYKGWSTVSQKEINKKVHSMPQRLKDMIELDGQMTG